MDNRPIGVFDSGVGGLTAVKELHRILPGESVVYFGDTGRVPYGTRGREIIRTYAAQDVRFLAGHGVKAIVAACNTVSANLSPRDVRAMGVELPFFEAVSPASRLACERTRGGRIGVIATTAAIRSSAYERAVHRINPDCKLFTNPCPLLVPLAENGVAGLDSEIARLTLEMYLAPLLGAKIDTLILGCTHYPLFHDLIRKIAGDGVVLVDSGAAAAGDVAGALARMNLLADGSHTAVTEYYVTDAVDIFREVARHFLEEELGDRVNYVELREIEK